MTLSIFFGFVAFITYENISKNFQTGSLSRFSKTDHHNTTTETPLDVLALINQVHIKVSENSLLTGRTNHFLEKHNDEKTQEFFSVLQNHEYCWFCFRYIWEIFSSLYLVKGRGILHLVRVIHMAGIQMQEATLLKIKHNEDHIYFHHCNSFRKLPLNLLQLCCIYC